MDDEILVLEKLNSLYSAKQFLKVLEIRYLDNGTQSSAMNLASKSLDCALMDLVFDIQRRVDAIDVEPCKVQISAEIIGAIDSVCSFNDLVLNRSLRDLVVFAENYESNYYKLSPESNQLKSRVLTIIAERLN